MIEAQKVEASKLDLHMSFMGCELVSALTWFLPVHWIVLLSLEMVILTTVSDCCDSVHWRPLQTDSAQTSLTEQFTVMLHCPLLELE